MAINTPVFRASYPKVFKAELNKLNGKMEFSVVALFPKTADLSALKKAAQDACIEKWGEDKTKWPKNLRSPFRDQGEKANDDGALPPGHEKGAIFMNFKSKNKPGVVDQNVQEIIDGTDFYPGCFAKAHVNAFAYDQAGNRGVSFGLNHIQKVKDGEPLDGRTRVEDAFAPIPAEENESTTESADTLFT